MITQTRIQSHVSGKKKKHEFFVIEISEVNSKRYPTTLFSCEILEEALKLCKQMNADAGHVRFAVRGKTEENPAE